MGKKRIAVIGDISAEEEARRKKEIKREQKALREGKLLKKIARKKKEEKKKAAKAPGLRGGERVVETTDKVLEEMELQKQKEAELTKLRQEAAKENASKQRGERQVKERSARYQEIKKKVVAGKKYKVAEAVKLLREVSLSKFDATVELHLNLTKAGLKFQVELPYSTGRTRKVAVADEKVIKKIKEGKIDFDVLLATPEQMPKLVPLAKILGPKGLMPNPKRGTVVKDPQEALKKFNPRALKLESEKKAPLIHAVVGKLSMEDSQLVENIEAVLGAIAARNLKKAIVKSTMSPGIKLGG